MDLRLAALRRFAIAITVLNVAGRAFLGFEQSLAQAFAALATAYSLEILFEVIEARLNHRSPRFKGASGRWLIFFCRVTSPVSQWRCFFMQTIRFFRSSLPPRLPLAPRRSFALRSEMASVTFLILRTSALPQHFSFSRGSASRLHTSLLRTLVE